MSHTARRARDILDHLMVEKITGILDSGGGDVSLLKLVDMAPDLVGRMVAGGGEPVTCYCLGPQIDLLEAGFRPRSTMLVLNEGRVDARGSLRPRHAAQPPVGRGLRRRGDNLDATV